MFRQQCDADATDRGLESHAQITCYKPRLQLYLLHPIINICQVPARPTIEYVVGAGDSVELRQVGRISFGHHTTEWASDLLFKKPWTLSRTVEFMAGIGPEWIHTRESGRTTNSVAGEAVLDFMFWPRLWKHRVGWYLEPGYEYNFGRGHERSIGISFGLLVAIRKQ